MDTLQLAGPAETVGASGTLSLVSLAETLAYLDKTSDSGGASDTRMQTLIDSVSWGAYHLMGGRFLKRPATPFDFVFTPLGEFDTLWLPQWPIGVVTSIQFGAVSQDATFNPDTTLVATDWYSDARSGRIYTSMPLTRHSVRVVWTGGYSTTPADAKEACMQWVGVKLQRATNSRWDHVNDQSAVEGHVYGDELPKFAADIFTKYKGGRLSLA